MQRIHPFCGAKCAIDRSMACALPDSHMRSHQESEPIRDVTVDSVSLSSLSLWDTSASAVPLPTILRRMTIGYDAGATWKSSSSMPVSSRMSFAWRLPSRLTMRGPIMTATCHTEG